MERHIQFTQKAIILLATLLAISCEKKEVWKQENLQIINQVLRDRCENVEKDTFNFAYVLLKEYSEEQFKNILKKKFVESALKNKVSDESIAEYIFSKENIRYYWKQLKSSKNLSYIDEIDENSCIKKKLPRKDKNNNIPFLCDWRCFYISKIVFTKNNEYALYVTYSGEGITSLNILQIQNNVFVPLANIFISIT